MLRARRLASVAVAAALTLGGLAACRSEPDVAAYYGANGRIPVSEVERIQNDIEAKRAAQPAEAAGQQPPAPISPADIVTALVSRQVVTEVARKGGVSLPAQLPLAEVAQSLQLPADAEYVRLYAESRLLLNGLLEKAPASTPPDADVRHVYDIFAATGAMQPGLTYEAFRGQVSEQALQTLGKALSVKQQVQAQVDTLDLRVNPRYSAAEIPVYSEAGPENKPLNLVSVPLTDADSSPVIDVA